MRRPHPYDLTTHDGKVVDWLTKAALMKAERLLGYPLSITQGSYNAGKVAASSGTHDRGGVVDLKAWDWQSKVRVLRQAGFVAWLRRADEGNWPDHIHAVLMDNGRLAPAAERQVHSFYAGRNGLKNNAPDPHPWPVRGFVWPYGGVVGLARWQRDQLRGRRRREFMAQLRRVGRGK